jgi:hypothetical protein
MSRDAKKFAQEIHHRVVRKFPRRKVTVFRIDEIWGIDLASMESFADQNNGFKWILCIIDVFSKFAWCIPLKNKSADTVLHAFINVVKKSGRSPEKIWVDRGSEFYNKDFLKWTKDNNVVIYSTYGESKSVVVERFIQTLKQMITNYFTETNSRNWVKILPKVVQTYNNREHRSIGMTPTQASDPENEADVFSRLNESPEITKAKKPKFSVGDHVRITRLKQTFEKGYHANFSYEVFTIAKILNTHPVTYKLADYVDDIIDGSFYEQELLKTNVPTYYEVENVVKTRKVGNKTQYLVHFYGWPKKFDEWVDKSQISNILEP